jgi:drug/metabolite transporter (DMT)-like permease
MISADVLVGAGDERQFVPARVEVEGSIDGWSVSRTDGPPSPDSTGQGDSVQVQLKRALGPLTFDLGICLVLLTLPALAMFTTFQVVTGRKEFQMPFTMWYAAMLFAIVPLRNILPGAPPPGAWIDQALVLWVIVALVSSMVVYIGYWYRRVD